MSTVNLTEVIIPILFLEFLPTHLSGTIKNKIKQLKNQNFKSMTCLTQANEYWQFTDDSVSLDINFILGLSWNIALEITDK